MELATTPVLLSMPSPSCKAKTAGVPTSSRPRRSPRAPAIKNVLVTRMINAEAPVTTCSLILPWMRNPRGPQPAAHPLQPRQHLRLVMTLIPLGPLVTPAHQFHCRLQSLSTRFNFICRLKQPLSLLWTLRF